MKETLAAKAPLVEIESPGDPGYVALGALRFRDSTVASEPDPEPAAEVAPALRIPNRRRRLPAVLIAAGIVLILAIAGWAAGTSFEKGRTTGRSPD